MGSFRDPFITSFVRNHYWRFCMRILFLGAGAVGGYFGGRMAQSGADVTFLVRENRAAQLAGGLRIESPNGDATVKVKTLIAGAETGPFDVVVLACKAYGLAGALDAVAPHVEKGASVLPLLNGFGHLDAIEARFPGATVWGGVAQIPATLTADGIVKQLAPTQGMIIGERPGQEATRVLAQEFSEIVTGAGIDGGYSATIQQAMWDKWVFLAALAAGTCLTNADVGTILETDGGEKLLVGLLDECTAVAAAENHRPDDARMVGYHNTLLDRSSSMSASMQRDMSQGNPTEADHVVGDMVRRARQHGLKTPYLDVAWTRLECYELLR
jgi:2-dehydropantoate 2-reductase